MAAAPAKQLTQLFGAFAGHADLTDAELLRRFVAGRDEAAFAALVGRHGPLVLGVCRRVLGEDHAAEDAFQATFLLLARKAARLTRDGSLAGWLFAAARRTAGQARRAERRRRRREAVAARPTDAAADDRAWREVRQVLDAELARLPERHRTPLILCYLNGLTQAEAARQLGWGETTLRGRLDYGRQVLRRRLARLGLPLAALLVPAATATVSAALRAETLATALTHNPLPPAVAALTGNPTRWRTAAGLLLAALCVGLAATAFSVPPQQPPSPPADAPVAAAQTKVDLLGDPLPPDALRRLGTLRHRHLWLWYTPKQPLPDGKTVLTATDRDMLWVDMTTGKLADSWPLPKRHQCRGLSPDGRLALLFDDSTMSLWDLSTRKQLRLLRYQGNYSTPTETFFSPDGKLLAVHSGIGRLPGLARVFDISTGRELWREGIPGDGNRGFWPLGFLGDGKTLAGLDVPGNAFQVRDRETGKVLRSFATLKRDRMQACLLTPDGKTLFLGEFGAKVRAWDVATGKELPPLEVGKGQGSRLAVSRDGKTVLAGGTAPELWVWDWPAGKLRRRIALAGDGPQALAVSADGKRAEVHLLGETALRFYDLETGQESPPPTAAHRGPANAVTVTPDGRVFSAGTDGTFREWDLQTGRHLRRSPGWQRLFGPILVPGPDHRLLAMANSLRGDVHLWDWRTGGVARYIDTGTNAVAGLALSPDGGRLAIGAFRLDPQTSRYLPVVALWDIANDKEERRLPGAAAGVLAFGPDGRLLAGFDSFRGGVSVHLWEVATGKERAKLPHKDVTALAFTPDGRALACGDFGGVTLWEVATGKERGRIAARADGNVLYAAPDGRWLARAAGRVVHLYDVRRLRLAHTFRGHDGDVRGLAFTPDGRALVSASADTTLLVWDVAGVAKRLAPPARPDAAAVEAAWKDLAAADAQAAYRAVRLLADAPGQSLPLLRERLRPVSPPDAEKVARLLAGLGSDRFGERTQAAEELVRLGEQAEGPLRRLLAGKPPLEVARRVEGMLARLEGPLTDPERLRQVRAAEVLEGIGNVEARRLLQTLAAGHADARQTREAAAALRRLHARP